MAASATAASATATAASATARRRLRRPRLRRPRLRRRVYTARDQLPRLWLRWLPRLLLLVRPSGPPGGLDARPLTSRRHPPRGRRGGWPISRRPACGGSSRVSCSSSWHPAGRGGVRPTGRDGRRARRTGGPPPLAWRTPARSASGSGWCRSTRISPASRRSRSPCSTTASTASAADAPTCRRTPRSSSTTIPDFVRRFGLGDPEFRKALRAAQPPRPGHGADRLGGHRLPPRRAEVLPAQRQRPDHAAPGGPLRHRAEGGRDPLQRLLRGGRQRRRPRPDQPDRRRRARGRTSSGSTPPATTGGASTTGRCASSRTATSASATAPTSPPCGSATASTRTPSPSRSPGTTTGRRRTPAPTRTSTSTSRTGPAGGSGRRRRCRSRAPGPSARTRAATPASAWS